MTDREPSVTFSNPPNPNVRIRFGEISDFHIQFYTQKSPNKFQCWMLRKVFGIWMELI